MIAELHANTEILLKKSPHGAAFWDEEDEETGKSDVCHELLV